MKNTLKFFFVMLICHVIPLMSDGQNIANIYSPDGNTKLAIYFKPTGRINYEISSLQNEIIKPVQGLTISLKNSKKQLDSFIIVSIDSSKREEDNWVSLWGGLDVGINNFREITLNLKSLDSTETNLKVRFRITNKSVFFKDEINDSKGFYQTTIRENIAVLNKTNEELIISFSQRVEKKVQYEDKKAKVESIKPLKEMNVVEKQRVNFSTNRTYSLRGSVKEAGTEKPLIGAAVSLDAKKTGILTDSSGNYYLRIPQDDYVVKVSFVGYKPYRKFIKLDKNTTLDVILEDVTKQLEEVIVSSVSTRTDIRTPSLGVSILSMKGIKKIPAMMGEVDVLRSLQTLPGVSSVGEGANGLNIRGGAVDENLIFIDDTPIFNPTHLFGLFSVFASDAIRELELYKGGIPARFGGRTASVLDIKMIEPSLEKFKFEGGIGPVSNRIMVEMPIIKNKLSFLTAGRASFNDFWFKLLAPDNFKNTRANFYDVANKIYYKPNAKNTFSLSTYFSQDFYRVDSLFSLENVVAKQTDFKYGHTNASLKWNHYFNPQTSLEIVGAYSNYKTNTLSPDSVNSIDLKNFIEYKNFKANLDYSPNEKHRTNLGISLVQYDLSPGVLNKNAISKISTVELAPEKSIELAIHADDEFKVNDKLTVQYGLRYTQFLNVGPVEIRKYQADEPKSSNTLLSTENKTGIAKTYGGLEPRITAVYVLNPVTSLKFGYNRTQQFLNLVNNNTTPLPTARWKISDENLLPQQSDFLSLGYFKTYNENVWEASLETYFRDTRNTIDYVSGANLQLNPTIETQLLQGRGRAYGAELMIAKKKGELTGWVSYTYARSLQLTTGQFAEQRINNGNWYASNFDKPHTVNIVLNATPDKHNSFSFIFAYNTGRAFSSPTGTYTLNGQQLPLYTARNNDRIPDYHRLDFSWTITNPSMKQKRWEGSWIFTVYNVYGRANPYSVFFTNGQDGTKVYQLSVFANPLPSLAYNFKFR